jgi:hypothetical protein
MGGISGWGEFVGVARGAGLRLREVRTASQELPVGQLGAVCLARCVRRRPLKGDNTIHKVNLFDTLSTAAQEWMAP